MSVKRFGKESTPKLRKHIGNQLKFTIKTIDKRRVLLHLLVVELLTATVKANGNVASWKLPQATPSLGTSGTCDPLTANSMHSGTVLLGLGDGSVRGVGSNISLRSWNAALTPVPALTASSRSLHCAAESGAAESGFVRRRPRSGP